MAATEETKSKKNERTKTGVVVSNKMQKTVVVAVENLVKHGMYQKYIKRTSKFLAHAENALNVGDRVVIEESRPLSKIRKTIARRLTEAWTVPAFQLTVNVDMTRANELVTKQRELNPDVRITITDVLTKLSAQALMRHRDMNVQYSDDALLVFPNADVGIAVALDAGLIVPVLRDADRKPLAALRDEREALEDAVRSGRARPSRSWPRRARSRPAERKS